MTTHVTPDRETLYRAIQDRYAEVAVNPEHTFHFHHGRPLAEILGYSMDHLDALPPEAVESFAGMGNPLSLGPVHSGTYGKPPFSCNPSVFITAMAMSRSRTSSWAK